MSTTTTHQDITRIYFTVHAECKNESGEVVERKLGIVRGMTDNGRPGWSDMGGTEIPDFDEAVGYTKHAYSWSVYDGHYLGGKVWIERNEVRTVTTITSEKHVVS